jgi:hypothetical protein
MAPSYIIKREILCNTINNYLRSFYNCATKIERCETAKIMFEYIIIQKKYTLDKNIMDDRFIETMKQKLIDLHYQNVPWAYNFYLILFNTIMPGVINEINIDEYNINIIQRDENIPRGDEDEENNVIQRDEIIPWGDEDEENNVIQRDEIIPWGDEDEENNVIPLEDEDIIQVNDLPW